VYQIPEAGRNSRGKPIVNMLELKPEEKIAAFVPVREFDNDHFIVAVTRLGVVNKQPLSAYANVRRDGINAINLDEGDCVIESKLTTGDNNIILGTVLGQAVRFHESAVRELGRNTRGVRGITLRGDDRVVSMIIVNEEGDVLTVTEKGFGKRTAVVDYRKTNRGGSGIINIKVTEKNGSVVALKGVHGEFDVMIVTRNGIIIRCDVGKISTIGRNTQGVKLISLDEGDSVIDIALCDKDTTPEGVVEAQPEVADPATLAEAAAPIEEGEPQEPEGPSDEEV
jgi:DNA gyrase subunit A